MVISELCQNWSGNKDLLWEMVDASAKAGAWACKTQCFFADDLAPNWQQDYDRVKKCELDWGTSAEFTARCRDQNLIPMTSVYSWKYADRLSRCGFKHIKIGSAQCSDKELIEQYIDSGFKVIVSTGGHTLSEVQASVPQSVYGVLHCVSLYPVMDLEALNMGRIDVLKHLYPDALVGFSDHTERTIGARVAIDSGARIIEKHFTLLPKEETKDGPVSADYEELKIICDYYKGVGARYIEQSRLFIQERELIKKYKTRWRRDDGPTS